MKKKILYCIISIVVSAGILVGSIFHIQAVDTDQKSYISKENKPIIYGTTAIRVPKGTQVDYKHDARFRVFAKDNEDGDLTQQIKAEVVESNIDTDVAGTYHIKYTVVDSDHNEATITVPVEVEETGTEIWLQKTMYTLPSVDHLNNLGYTRGNYMDRQMIGVFLDVNGDDIGQIQMRKISGTGDLTVTIQNNNNWCQTTTTITNSTENDGWQTVSNSGASEECDGTLAAVPTVKTLYKQTGPVIYEIKYNIDDAKVKPLHYYHEGDGAEYEAQFLQEWQADTDSYAMLDGLSFMALMPYEDRAHVYDKSSQRSFDSFDETFAFWNQVMDIYDELIGISYTPEHEWDQAVKTKFFLKANKHGPGSAYYALYDCIGKTSTEMYSTMQQWWGTLHEYGHGYQGNVGASGNGMPITEIAVNIFSYYIQQLSGLYKYNDNWLGNIDANEETWNQKRKEGVKFTDTALGTQGTLYTFINMLNATGEYKEAYAYVNQYFREVYYTTGKKLKTQDAWVLAYEKKYHLNLVPYFESWGIEISEDVKDQMMQSNAEVVYYLGDIVSDSNLATSLKEKYHKIGEYDLVTASELKAENLTGTVNITFEIDDFSNIKNKYLIIKDGDQEVAKVLVTSPEMTLTLPIGTYRVAPPRGNVALEYDRFYMTVVAGKETSYTIHYRGIDDISYGNGITIYSLGNYDSTNDATKIPFKLELQGNTLHITYRGTRIKSSGYSSDVFSKITVSDKNGNEKHSKSVSTSHPFWTDVLVDTYDIDMELGDQITLYYIGNKNDVIITSDLTGESLENYKITDEELDQITYVMTQYGLVPETIAKDNNALYQLYKERVTTYVSSYLSNHTQKEYMDPFANQQDINLIIDLVSKLEPTDQKPYQQFLQELIVNEPPKIELKQNYFTFKVSDHKTLEDMKQYIVVTDLEDGLIDVNSEKVTLISNVIWNVAGHYTITITAVDSQDNKATEVIYVTIEEDVIKQPEQEPSEQKPSEQVPSEQTPSNENTSNSNENQENHTTVEQPTIQQSNSQSSTGQTSTQPSHSNGTIQGVEENIVEPDEVTNIENEETEILEEEKEVNNHESTETDTPVVVKKKNYGMIITIGIICFGIIVLIGIKVAGKIKEQ